MKLNNSTSDDDLLYAQCKQALRDILLIAENDYLAKDVQMSLRKILPIRRSIEFKTGIILV